MDSINSILGHKSFDEPPEINDLKKFIRDNYSQEASISINGQALVISVNSSALASSLRLRLPEIKRSLKIDKRIVLRIEH